MLSPNLMVLPPKPSSCTGQYKSKISINSMTNELFLWGKKTWVFFQEKIEFAQLKPCVAWKIAISWNWHCQIDHFETSILNILLRVHWNLEAEGTVVALAQQTFDQNKPNKIEIRLLFGFSPFSYLFVARIIYHTRSAQVTWLIGFWQHVASVAFIYIICNDIGK